MQPSPTMVKLHNSSIRQAQNAKTTYKNNPNNKSYMLIPILIALMILIRNDPR